MLPLRASNRPNEVHLSQWFEEKDKSAFYRRFCRPGDLIEFDRGSYRHWAVFVGTAIDFGQVLGDEVPFECSSCSRPGTNCRCDRFYVVHRANPGDSNALRFFSRSQSFAKGVLGIGSVILEAVDDVWGGSKARRNNQFDPSYPPIPCNRILARAFRWFQKHAEGNSQKFNSSIPILEIRIRLPGAGRDDEYNLITNNCEHFACWCRYGKKESEQIKKGVLALGLTTVTAAAVAGLAAYRGRSPQPEHENENCASRRPGTPVFPLSFQY